MVQPNPISTEEKVVETVVEKVVDKVVDTPKEDLVSRVSKVKVEEPKKEEEIFNVTDIEKIEDPKAKEYATKAYKSLLGDYTRKMQELSEMRKSFQKEPEKWTPEKVQSLLNDQTFVESARSIVGTPHDDGSMLTEAEKHELTSLKDKIRQMETQTWNAIKIQQDEALKQRYANYDPQAVDYITGELIQGKRNATREDIFKAMDYENAVKRAYELGRQDKEIVTKDKIESSSIDGGAVTSTGTPPPQEKNESDRAYFRRLAERRLAEFVNKKK